MVSPAGLEWSEILRSTLVYKNTFSVGFKKVGLLVATAAKGRCHFLL